MKERIIFIVTIIGSIIGIVGIILLYTTTNESDTSFAIFGAIASVFNKIVGVNHEQKQARRDFRYSKELAEQQGEINKDFAKWNFENVTKPTMGLEQEQWLSRFNAENEYNSPENQVALMRAAGINPAGTELQSFTGANPSTSTAQAQFADAPSVAEQQQLALNSRSTQYDGVRLLADTAKTIAETKLLKQQEKRESINNETLAQINQGQLSLQGLEIQFKKEETANTKEQRDAIKANVKVLEQQGENLKKQLDETAARISNIQESTNKIMTENEYQKKVNAYYEKQQDAIIKEYMSRCNVNYAQAKLLAENWKNSMIQGDLLTNELNFSNKSFNERLQAKNAELRYNKRYFDVSKEGLRIVEKDNDFNTTYWWANKAIQLTNQVLGVTDNVSNKFWNNIQNPLQKTGINPAMVVNPSAGAAASKGASTLASPVQSSGYYY